MGVRVYNKKTGVSVTCDAKYWADCKDHNVKAGFQLWTPAMTAGVNHIPVNNGDDAVITPSAYASNSFVTEVEKEFHSGNTFGGILTEETVKLVNGGNEEKLVVINAQLGGEAVGLDAGDTTYVSMLKEEARFMDMDKKTSALGYSIFKDGFKWGSDMVLVFKLHGTYDDKNVYEVTRLDD